MAEHGACDVWVLRLDGDDKARLVAASRLFRVDVRRAQHILESLPRLVARTLPSDAGRKLAQQIQALGGVGHVCASGETPDFNAITGAAARRAVAARKPRTGDVAAETARAVQDAAMLRWPEEQPEPYVWEGEDAQLPPPVPRPVRHSAARIAGLLAVVMVVLGGGATTYWLRFGHELTRVSAASWQTPDAGVDSDEPVIAEPTRAAATDAAVPADEVEALAPTPH